MMRLFVLSLLFCMGLSTAHANLKSSHFFTSPTLTVATPLAEENAPITYGTTHLDLPARIDFMVNHAGQRLEPETVEPWIPTIIGSVTLVLLTLGLVWVFRRDAKRKRRAIEEDQRRLCDLMALENLRSLGESVSCLSKWVGECNLPPIFFAAIENFQINVALINTNAPGAGDKVVELFDVFDRLQAAIRPFLNEKAGPLLLQLNDLDPEFALGIQSDLEAILDGKDPARVYSIQMLEDRIWEISHTPTT